MTYITECTGSATSDRQQTNYGGYQPGAHMDVAYGQRFVPTSKCLDSVTLRMRRIENLDVDIEIRSDSGGIPAGNIGSGYMGWYRIPYTSIPTSFSNINIPFGIILPDLNPKWIVIYSHIYDPNYYDPMFLFDLDGEMITNATEYSAVKVANDAWNIGGKTRQLYYQTYKKTYTIPCTTPGCGFDIT